MISHWLLAARLKTLPVSLCPVILGLAFSKHLPSFSILIASLIILCVLFIQIGTNYANDYFDYIKGADTSERTGPKRMTQSGAISPLLMKRAYILMFFLAICCGLYLVYYGGWPILLIGLLSVFFGVIYTAGPYALAYIGGAEFIAFIFFGPVSVIGTYYLQSFVWQWEFLYISSALGLITTALLVVNNTRDMDSDRKVNKKTFAVRFGRLFSYVEFILCLYIPILLLDYMTEDSTPQMVLVLFLVFIAMILTRRFGKAHGEGFNRLLGLTSGYLILFTTIAIYLLV